MAHAGAPTDRYILMVGLGLPTTDRIDLRLPPALERELLAIFDEEAVHYSRVVELSAEAASDWPVYSVVLGTTAALGVRRLSQALATFLQRHKYKYVKVSLRDETVEAKGCSVEEAQKLVKSVFEAKQADREQWNRVTRQEQPENPPEP